MVSTYVHCFNFNRAECNLFWIRTAQRQIKRKPRSTTKDYKHRKPLTLIEVELIFFYIFIFKVNQVKKKIFNFDTTYCCFFDQL